MGLGAPEIILIIVAIVLLFGVKKIPDLMKGLGTGIKEFKKAANEIESTDNNSNQTSPQTNSEKTN